MRNQFPINTRIKRVGKHLANGGTDYRNNECVVGDTGVVEAYHPDGEVSVLWDSGQKSRIVAASLEKVGEDGPSEQEIQELFGIAPVTPCSKCGCTSKGKH